MRFGHKNNTAAKVLFTISILLALAILLLIFVDIRMKPVAKTFGVNEARSEAIATINDAVGKVLRDNEINYDTLMSFEKSGSGSITAVKANSGQIDLLKYKVTDQAIKNLKALKNHEYGIPLGTLIGGQIFSGLGPTVYIDVEPIGSVNAQIDNKFSSAGINQTRQQIYLDVKTEIMVILASYDTKVNIETNYCIADTVIVGSVPDSYTVVGDDSGVSTDGKIYAYGSSESKKGTKSGSSSTSGKR